MSRSAEYITEWRRFGFEPRERAFFVLFLLSWLMVLLSLKKQRPSSILLLVLGSYLGFSAVRHTPLIAILGMPALMNAFAGVGGGQARENYLSRSSSAVILMLSLVLLWSSLPAEMKIVANNDLLPQRVVNYMERQGLSGNMFVPLHWGGYVLYRMAPEVKVSIDGRWATTYPVEVMDLNMRFYAIDDADTMRNVADRYSTDYILFEKGHPEIANVISSEDWGKLFEGDHAVLVARN